MAEVVSAYLLLILRHHSHIHIVESMNSAWHLSTIDASAPEYSIDDSIAILFIPTHVNKAHWMLPVCSMPTKQQVDGELVYYNSLAVV